jgi:hypothetical protein
VATSKAIVKESEAHIAKLEKQETHEAEGHESEEREPETHEQEVSVLSSQGHVDQILTERWLSERRTGGSNVHFPCLLSQLRKNMVATIQQSRKDL